ncbi:hypothetical protein ACOSQ3_019011 [Xanthoceras sorbifolium]
MDSHANIKNIEISPTFQAESIIVNENLLITSTDQDILQLGKAILVNDVVETPLNIENYSPRIMPSQQVGLAEMAKGAANNTMKRADKRTMTENLNSRKKL